MNFRSKRVRRILFISACILMVIIAGCAHQPPAPLDATDVPGFWSGLLHGFLIVFSFVGSLFTDIRIYQFPNSGGWYDFGYVLGAAFFLGGSGASA
jgi:hypothetical protein